MASPKVVFIKTFRHDKRKTERDLQKTLHFLDVNNILILALEHQQGFTHRFTMHVDQKMLVITKFNVAFR